MNLFTVENPEITKHIRDLNDANEYVRGFAAEMLGKTGNTYVVPVLEKALKDKKYHVRACAATALGKIGDASAIPALIKALKDTSGYVRCSTIETLGLINNVAAIPALIVTLKDKHSQVRCCSAKVLGEIGDASTAIVLTRMFNDNDQSVRRCAIAALGKIGVSALPILIESLKAENANMRLCVAEALSKMGDSQSLPRKILAQGELSSQAKIDLLEKLSKVRYKDKKINIHYMFSDITTLCKSILAEENNAARAGARAVLKWLNEDQFLLHASQRDNTTEAQQLLRAHERNNPETEPDILLRASDEPKANTDHSSSQPTIWQRLFGKRTDHS